jgi:excisionase family DNA binding protein
MYTTEEVAKIVRGTRHTVDGMCARDKLRYIKRGNKRLFPESWLQEDLMKMAKIGSGD